MKQKRKSTGIILIGKTVKIELTSKSVCEIFEGLVVDETKNLICIKTKNGIKKIIKENSTLKFNNKNIIYDNLTGRIEERIKNS